MIKPITVSIFAKSFLCKFFLGCLFWHLLLFSLSSRRHVSFRWIFLQFDSHLQNPNLSNIQTSPDITLVHGHHIPLSFIGTFHQNTCLVHSITFRQSETLACSQHWPSKKNIKKIVVKKWTGSLKQRYRFVYYICFLVNWQAWVLILRPSFFLLSPLYLVSK